MKWLTLLGCIFILALLLACVGDPGPNPDGNCRAPAPCTQVRP